MLVSDAYEKFMDYGRTYWAPGSISYYERNLGYFFRYLEQVYERPVDQIDVSLLPDDILFQYVIWLRSKNRYSNHPLSNKMCVNGKIKSNTVNAYMRAVKAFFNHLYQARIVDHQFTDGLKLPRSDYDQIVPLLSQEVDLIDSLFDQELPNDLRNLCIIHLMLDAGLRSCEVISLTAGNVIFASGTIVINRSKGDKSRVVIMAPKLAALLRKYMDIFHPHGLMFKKVNANEPIDSSVFNALFKRLRRNTGIGRLHPHLLRHTFATSYIMGGGNLEKLRILLGHSDYSVTRMYLHLAVQYQIMDADIYRLDPVFFKSSY